MSSAFLCTRNISLAHSMITRRIISLHSRIVWRHRLSSETGTSPRLSGTLYSLKRLLLRVENRSLNSGKRHHLYTSFLRAKSIWSSTFVYKISLCCLLVNPNINARLKLLSSGVLYALSLPMVNLALLKLCTYEKKEFLRQELLVRDRPHSYIYLGSSSSNGMITQT